MSEDKTQLFLMSSCGCSHEGCSHVQADPNENSLFRFIHLERVRCLNEEVDGSVVKILRPFDRKLSGEGVCRSEEDDEQMILFVPFTASVRLTSICFIGSGDTCPRTVRCWINREDIDFSNVEDAKPTHVFEVAENPTGELEYPADPLKFQNVHSLTFWIEENHGGSRSELSFLGFKGVFLSPRVGVVIATYESRPVVADHKAPDSATGTLHFTQ